MKLSALVLLGLFGCASTVYARVFDFSTETYAPYLRGTSGPSLIKKTAFADSDGDGAVVSDQATSNFSGELGLAISFAKATIRLGYEGLTPTALKDIEVKNAGGDVLYKMNSNIMVTAPKISLDLHLKQWPTSRLIMFFTASYPKVIMSNEYTLTTDGQAAYPGIQNYLEQGVQQSIAYEGGLGYEILMADTTTVALEAGYRQMKFGDMTHNKAITNFDGDVIAKKDPVRDRDGSKRELDFSTYYVGMTLKFYIRSR